MTIAEFVGDVECMKGYAEWLKNPVTQALLEIASVYGRPPPLKAATGENALYQYGMAEGANLILMLFTNMDELVKQQKIAELMSADPTYGAEKIMKEKYE